MNDSTVVIRAVDESARTRLIAEDIHPLMARIFAARGIENKSGLDTSFAALLPFKDLSGIAEAARLLADAIAGNERLLIVADYDADGATACALGVSVLRQLGADIGYLVPNRFEHGYGLTPEIVELAVVEQPAETTTEPAAVARAETEVAEPAVVAQTAEVVTEPAIVTQTGTVESETAVIEETTKPAAEAVALNTPATEAETAPDIARELETATQTPVLPEAKTGKWVINLSSYTRKPTAERMLAVFQRKGVDAEVFSTTINDKPMHRIRMTGFQSARSAKAEISTLEQQLDLEGAWVSKR